MEGESTGWEKAHRQLLGTGMFVEAIFSCTDCQVSATALIRREHADRHDCPVCGCPVPLTVL